MDYHAVQVFRTVATERSFSRAAERLFRTQPAISMVIRRLEEELGEKLIDRSGRELLLTDAGRLVLEYACRLDNLARD
ncbi:MAG: LysR family transcriptional regulator, partial [Acidobacteria bacterium]|nr:LysR family transcriptional regulator [Acidobacteriota bacterium]